MMPNQDFENALIRKKYTKQSPHTEERDVILTFVENDTKFLMPGVYYLEAKLRVVGVDGNEKVFTVLPKKILQLEE